MNFTCPNDGDGCTLQTCPIECGQVRYVPTLGGNVAYAVILGVLLLFQLGLGIFYRTWGFLVGMVCGLVLEVVGYAGRILLHYNPFIFNNFLTYLIPLTIGPAFLCGSIYLCLARIIVVYGQHISRLSPRAGGGISATANSDNGSNIGRYIMIAGLAIQVLSLTIFMFLWLEFLLRLRKVGESQRNNQFKQLRTSGWRFKSFSYLLWLATILIFIRSVYRIIELQAGFYTGVADNEIAFMILEGPMIILAVLSLTIMHPGFAFQGNWHAAAWSFRGQKQTNASDELNEKYRADSGGA